jgi:hypothetical protein
MRDIIVRARHADSQLLAELLRRAMFTDGEKAELSRILGQQNRARSASLPLGPVQFASLLASGDTQLAARAVLRDIVRPNELRWLNRLLRFQESSDKRNELCRIVERAIEGRKGNVRARR